MRSSWEISGIDALLFDLDGVLVNSLAAIDMSMRRWAVERGLDADEVVALAHGRRDSDLVRMVAPDLHVATEVARIAELDFEVLDQLRAVAGAAEITAALAAGSWAVVTSGGPRIAGARLAAAGLPEPPLLISADDVTNGKPDPEGYLLAAGKLGAAPHRCVVFEDAPVGLSAATAAGMRCVGVGADLAGARERLAAWVGDLDGITISAESDGLRLAGRHSPAFTITTPGGQR